MTTATIRRFVHVDGFIDRTAYVEVTENDVVLVMRNGTRQQRVGLTLQDCERYIREGDWREVKKDECVERTSV